MPHESSQQASGADRIAAIARGPGSVFVYWTLGGRMAAEAAAELGPDCQWVLRVLDLADGSSRTVPVDPGAGNYYLNVRPGRTYGFELAVKAGNRWRTICRTRPVRTPRGMPAPAGQEPGGPIGGGRLLSRGMGVAGLTYESTPPPGGSSPSAP